MKMRDSAIAMNRAGLAFARTLTAVGLTLGLSGWWHDGANAQPPPLVPVVTPEPSAPAGAPNVLIVMTDDVGFGASAPYGGPVPTPTFAALAASGLRYNRFHTAAMCSPTRAALLTGRNHHSVGSGTITELATGDRGYTSILPQSAATLGQILRMNGYSTAWFGKNHNTPEWEQTSQGPFNRWPNALGFDYFYGFFGGTADPQAPALIENTRLVEPPREAGYFLETDLVDRAVSWLRTQSELTPTRPFLLYLAPLTAHSPHRAPAEWIERFRGRFDLGWDRAREETFERQKRLGIIPADTVLTPRPEEIPSWDSLSADEQRVAARMMEVFAAQLAYFDHELGRVIEELRRSGRYENTLIIYIQGDNGASVEGTLAGTLTTTFGGPVPDASAMLARLDEFGGPTTYQNYPVGWAWAMNTPFQWGKQQASHLGGTRTGLAISWPARIRDRGAIRTQFSHVVDIAPTVYDLIGIVPPTHVNGVRQLPVDGISMAYTFDRPEAPSRRASQYFEMLGNQAWYEDGWLASTRPAVLPWLIGPSPAPSDYQWELYDLRTDYSQSRDLAAVYPERLAELRSRFMQFAERRDILPLQNRIAPRLSPTLRPYVTNGRSEFEFGPGARRITDQSFPDVKNRAWTLEADVVLGEGDPNGAVINQGGWFGGWGLFVREGRPQFVYRESIWEDGVTIVGSPERLPAGPHSITVSLRPDSPERGAGAEARLSVDGRMAATAHISRTVALGFKKEGVGIGREAGTGLLDVRAVPDLFGGEIVRIRLRLHDAGEDHQVAMPAR